ncbi:MAG: VWA domain-containing protein [Deltaproteobacteria bacterium]|nr:VWA domain-containing protein [Deltaproteobacteria bacterium]
MSFERPWVLALLPVALSLWALGLRRGSVPRRALSAALALASMVALLLAGAGVQRARWTDRRVVLVLVDRSRSMDFVPGLASRVTALLRESAEGARPEDALGVVSFAGVAETALVASAVARGEALSMPTAPAGAGARDHTRIDLALMHGLGELPDGVNGRLVLVSDGDQTAGDALGAASLAGARGIPVDVVALSRPARADVAALRLRAPDRVERGEPVGLALVLRSDREGRGVVELLRDGVRLGAQPVRFGVGEDVVHLADVGDTPGVHRYEARLVPDDGLDEVPGNERAVGFVRVAGGARALVVDGLRARGGGSLLAEGLRAAGLTVDLVGPEGAPEGAGEWGAYDLVVLSEVRMRELDPLATVHLSELVRELGLGLWMTGSDRSFGPGGYARTPLEEVLPVTLDLRRQRSRASVALAVMIDRSGSMSAPTRDGRTKIDLANEAAARSAALLSPLDRVAIAHVDTSVDWTWRLHLADDPEAVARAARAGRAGGGGIYTDVALRSAYELLGDTRATIRHVILLADGGDAEQAEDCPRLAAEALRRNLTTSVVAIGRGHDEAVLERIARAGGGRYYLTEDARRLPAIFAEETVLAARNAVREEPFRPAFLRGVEVLRGVDPRTVPAVQGWVVTEPRGRAEVLAEAPEHAPWLARWQVGVGRSAVLTSDLNGRWTAEFGRWPGASALVSQLGLWLARGVRDGGVRVAAVPTPGRLRVEVDATTDSGRWDSALDLVAHVTGPAGEHQRVPLEPRGPGRYEAEVPATRGGSWLVAVSAASQGLLGVTGAEVLPSAELASRGGDPQLLSALARRSGGTVRTSLRGVFREPRERHREARPWTVPWLWLGLLGLLASVASRRLPPVDASRLWSLLPRRRAPEPAPAAPQATDHALALLRARRSERVGPAAPEPGAHAPRAPASPPSPQAPAAPKPVGGLDTLVDRTRKRRGGQGP